MEIHDTPDLLWVITTPKQNKGGRQNCTPEPRPHTQPIHSVYLTYLTCEPMGRGEIYHTSSLLVEIEGHFTHEFVTYVNETQDWLAMRQSQIKVISV
jgi:hypothetical protein